MRQRGGGAGFAQEALAQCRLGSEVGRQQLEGDEAVEADFAGEVDDAHAAAAELVLDGVASREGGLQVEQRLV